MIIQGIHTTPNPPSLIPSLHTPQYPLLSSVAAIYFLRIYRAPQFITPNRTRPKLIKFQFPCYVQFTVNLPTQYPALLNPQSARARRTFNSILKIGYESPQFQRVALMGFLWNNVAVKCFPICHYLTQFHQEGSTYIIINYPLHHMTMLYE